MVSPILIIIAIIGIVTSGLYGFNTVFKVKGNETGESFPNSLPDVSLPENFTQDVKNLKEKFPLENFVNSVVGGFTGLTSWIGNAILFGINFIFHYLNPNVKFPTLTAWLITAFLTIISVWFIVSRFHDVFSRILFYAMLVIGLVVGVYVALVILGLVK